MKSGSRISRPAVAALLLSLPGTFPAAASSLSWWGTGCRESSVSIAVDPDRVRPLVPDRFQVFTLGPDAYLYIWAVDCTQVASGSRSPIATRLASVSVVLNPEGVGDGHSAVDLLDLEYVTDNAGLALDLGDLGFLIERNDIEFEMTSSVAITTFAADVSSADSPFSYDGCGPALLSEFDVLFTPFTHYHVGSQGLIRTVYDHTKLMGSGGIGTVYAEPGTPLANLMRDPTSPGQALVFRFDATAVTEQIE